MISLTGKSLPRKINKEGFTFIELILVAVIIGIIIALSTPLFRTTFNTLQLESLSSNLAKFIRYSQERAIVERLRYRLVFNDSQHKYWLEVEKDPLNGAGEFQRLKSRWGKVHSVPEGIFLETGKKKINFYPDGKTSKNTIYLSNKKGTTYTLIMGGTLGRVQVFNYRKEE